MKFDHFKKKTYTRYWNNFSEKPKKSFYASIFLKKLKKYFNKVLGYKISIRINKNKIQKDEAYVSYPVEKIIKKHRNKLIIKELYSFLECSGLEYKQSSVEKYLDEFTYVFTNSPIKEHESGFGYNEGIFFYTILKIIEPELVIESGVMKGFTTYLIDAATHDDCEIYSYDINFENNMFVSKKAKYINSDITKKIPMTENKKTVALWDVHTSQLDRLKFSQENNIHYNFFDDDLSLLNIHSDGWPPVPTISMLQDIKKNEIKLDKLSWISRDREGIVYLKELIDHDLTNKIKFHKIFPQLFPITGYKNHSQCSLVINKFLR